MTIFDHLLQLIATVSALTGDEDKEDRTGKKAATEEEATMTIALGTEVMELSLPAFGRTVMAGA